MRYALSRRNDAVFCFQYIMYRLKLRVYIYRQMPKARPGAVMFIALVFPDHASVASMACASPFLSTTAGSRQQNVTQHLALSFLISDLPEYRRLPLLKAARLLIPGTRT